MAIVTRKRKRETSDVMDIFGGEIPSERIAVAGMRDLERELNRQFKSMAAEQRESVRIANRLYAPILKSVEGNANVAGAVRELRARDARAAKLRLAVPVMDRVIPRVFAGSIGVTFAPPYNYNWTWNAISGAASDHSVAANRTTGQMSFGLHTSNGSDAASASGRVAVGAYYRPATEYGILRINAAPSFNYNWWTACAFASAHSDGFIGLYVGRYTLAGGLDGAPVNQMISLWNDSSWWSGSSGSASNSGYGLSAQINVDRSHYYLIWVWCGGNVSASGWHTFSGAAAGAYMNVGVPAIQTELF